MLHECWEVQLIRLFKNSVVSKGSPSHLSWQQKFGDSKAAESWFC
jgi:hypothetical protein